MLISRGAAKILVALVFVVCATQGVKADLFNEGSYGAIGNDGKLIGGIRDIGYDSGDPQVALHELFNAFFSLTGNEAYGSSNELFKDRGVISDKWIAGEAEFYGVNKVAALAHNLNFQSDAGANLGTIVVPATVDGGNYDPSKFDAEFTGSISLSYGEVFSMNLETFFNGRLMGTVDTNTYGATYNDTSGNRKSDELVHMIALDVTDLMQAMLDYKIDSAYMFCWEDLPLFAPKGGMQADWDFQDLVYIMVNVAPKTKIESTPTPEPATMLILLTGLAACPLARRLRKK